MNMPIIRNREMKNVSLHDEYKGVDLEESVRQRVRWTDRWTDGLIVKRRQRRMNMR